MRRGVKLVPAATAGAPGLHGPRSHIRRIAPVMGVNPTRWTTRGCQNLRRKVAAHAQPAVNEGACGYASKTGI